MLGRPRLHTTLIIKHISVVLLLFTTANQILPASTHAIRFLFIAQVVLYAF